MNLGERIALLRGNKKITQEKFAKILGITRAGLSMYETNKRKPDPDTLEKIADFFDVSTDYLLGRTDIKIPMDKIVNENLDHTSKTILEIESLTPESQEELKKYLELLKIKDKVNKNKDNNELATLE